MKPFFPIVLCAFLAAGCTPSSREVPFEVLPAELKDCKIFRIKNSEGDAITVARCPNSTTSTTYPSGKTSRTAVVIDGVEHVPVEKAGKKP